MSAQATREDVLDALKTGLPVSYQYQPRDGHKRNGYEQSAWINANREGEQEVPVNVLAQLEKDGLIRLRMSMHLNHGSKGGSGVYAVLLVGKEDDESSEANT